MIVDPFELRARPSLIPELRAEPGKYVERRFAPMANVETRESDDGSYKIGGLAAVFDQLSVNLGGFREIIDRGAFRKVLASKPDVRCYINHDMNLLLGRTASDTLRLREVPKGLDYEADAPDTSYARDLRALLSRGDINQSSFAFRLAPGGDTWDEDPDTGGLIRRIHEFAFLYDVSPVADPAYPQTTSGLRSLEADDQQPSPRASAQQPGDEGEPSERDTSSAETLQGEPYMLAARQRRLRQRQILIGR